MTYIQKTIWAIQHCRRLGKSSGSLETFVWEQQVKPVNFWKYTGPLNSRDEFTFVWSSWGHLFDPTVCCLGFCRNCAPALSIIQNGAVGRALPELFHRPDRSPPMTVTGRWGTPAASIAPASTSLHCGSGRWCSRPPLLQFRLGWSLFQQSNLDLPHGKGGERGESRERKGRGEEKKEEWERQEMDVSLLRASLCSGVVEWCRELQGVRGVRADVQIFSRACTDGLVFATLKRFC